MSREKRDWASFKLSAIIGVSAPMVLLAHTDLKNSTACQE
jgi:hypothetical protein